MDDTLPARELLARASQVQGLREVALQAGVPGNAAPPVLAAAVDFVLEGLYALSTRGRNRRSRGGRAPGESRPSRSSSGMSRRRRSTTTEECSELRIVN